MPTQSLSVGPDEKELRLDVFLTRQMTDLPSRSYAQKLIESGCVKVNKKQVKSHYKVQPQDEVTVDVPDDFWDDQTLKPENIPLDIFYEDEWLLVINKPCGMIVHPAQGCYSGTLVNALLYYCKSLSDINSSIRPGIVHRLDQDTSGLILVAKDNKTHAELAKQFQDHLIKKRYAALVEGQVEFDEGKIDAAIGRNIYHRDKKAVSYDEEARDAITYYKVLKRAKGVTLMALYPKTGRTHQLRVHMAHLKHPILGDEKYGKKSSFSRLALHAQSIGFTHPRKKVFVEFSTKTPAEFLDRLK